MDNVFVNAHTPKGKELIRRYFSTEELAEMKDELATNCINLQMKQDELDEIKAEFKTEIEPMKKVHKAFLTHIKQGFIDEAMEVYYVPDFDKSIMEMYDMNGRKVYERKMTQSERQQEIPFNVKAKTN